MNKIKMVFLTFTIDQIRSILRHLYVACDNSKGEYLKDNHLMSAIKTMQAELQEKTGGWL